MYYHCTQKPSLVHPSVSLRPRSQTWRHQVQHPFDLRSLSGYRSDFQGPLFVEVVGGVPLPFLQSNHKVPVKHSMYIRLVWSRNQVYYKCCCAQTVHSGSPPLMRISLLQISLLQFFKTFLKYLAYAFLRLIISLLPFFYLPNAFLCYLFHYCTRLCKEHCYKKKAASVGQNGRLSASCNFFSFWLIKPWRTTN